MKKSLLTFSICCLALGAMAAAPSEQKFQPKTQAPFARNAEIKSNGSLRVAPSPASLRKAPAKTASPDDIIYSAEGRRQNITLTGSGYYLMWGMFDEQYFDQSVATHMVYGANNEVYLFNPLPNLNENSYIKGTKEGDKVTFEFPQTIGWYEEFNDGYQVALFEYYEFEDIDEETGEPETYYSYAPTDVDSLTFTLQEDGSMMADGLAFDGLLVGAGYCSDGEWSGYGAYELAYVDFNEVLVEVPSDIEVSKDFYSYVCPDLGYGWTLNIAQRGEEIYFQGFSTSMPEAWVKATVEYGDSEAIVSIAQNQFIGIKSGVYIFTKAARIVYDEEDDWYYYELLPERECFDMIWDYEENTMKPKDPEVSLLFNTSKEEVYFIEDFSDFTLRHQDSFAGVPQNPYGIEFEAEWNELSVNIPAFSVEGDVLKTEDLYYVVYVDDEAWIFSANDYSLEEDMVEVPWDFENWDFMSYGGCLRVIQMYVEGISSIGVQSVYRYGGEETRSETVWYDVDPVSVSTIDDGLKTFEYFDLTGRRVENPQGGIFIRRQGEKATKVVK